MDIDLDRGTRVVLRELRELRVEMPADRRRSDKERRQADEERRQADEQRRLADEAWREERRRADEAWRQERLQAEARWKQSQALTQQVIQRSDQRFEQALREFREDSVRRTAETRKMFKDIRGVGLSIVKTLNLHTKLLERIDRKLGALGPWRPSSGAGRGA